MDDDDAKCPCQPGKEVLGKVPSSASLSGTVFSFWRNFGNWRPKKKPCATSKKDFF